jgi:hypothetical protein
MEIVKIRTPASKLPQCRREFPPDSLSNNVKLSDHSNTAPDSKFIILNLRLLQDQIAKFFFTVLFTIEMNI